jgi:ABC-type methionine transport system ATPase subunit
MVPRFGCLHRRIHPFMSGPVLELSGVSKNYHGLRPLRIERLIVQPHDRVALLGFDRPAAEVFVNLVTGAWLPDEGDIRLFGKTTASIADSTEWLATVDRIGIVSDRAVLLDGLTVLQNLALPFTLAIEPPPKSVCDRACELAREVGIAESTLGSNVGDLTAAMRLLVRIGRALALDPAMLLMEHATAAVSGTEAATIGERLHEIANERRIAIVAATADERFASAVASRLLVLRPPTGRLAESAPKRLRR